MTAQTPKSALIAMSGGVDSSVAALLMKRQGYDCIGATMKLYSQEKCQDSHGNTCCTAEDAEDARQVARQLGIPYYVFHFSDRFEAEVISRFVDAYENGRTPNPCIDCNRYLKFGALLQRAAELGCGCIATGHYARIEFNPDTGRYLLKKAADTAKDQSYVLWTLRQEQLAHTQLPLGKMTKADVRQLAEQAGFATAHKHDSQDICFVPDGKYARFLEDYTQKSYPPGNFADMDGHVLGRHKGIIRYTVGQKKGLGLVLPEPLYVYSVDPQSNTVTLCREEQLFSDTVIAHDINLISLPSIREPMRIKAKVRYRQREEWATVTQPEPDTLQVVFDQPQRAVTKGQSLVLYDGDTVVGGGIIS